MSKERNSAGFRALGDHKLAISLDRLREKLARRHTDITNISLTGRLPEETLKLDPFFERDIRTIKLTIGGKSPQELLGALDKKRIDIDSFTRGMVENPEFTYLPEPTQIVLAIAEVGILKPGASCPTKKEIFEAADEKGLDLLPAEALIHLVLQDGFQMMPNESIMAAMKPITYSGGGSHVFYLKRYDSDRLSLNYYWEFSRGRSNPSDQFAFSIPTPTTGEAIK